MRPLELPKLAYLLAAAVLALIIITLLTDNVSWLVSEFALTIVLFVAFLIVVARWNRRQGKRVSLIVWAMLVIAVIHLVVNFIRYQVY